jgi:hypothetical protein
VLSSTATPTGPGTGPARIAADEHLSLRTVAAGDPVRRNRRYLCSHKESQHAGSKFLNRTVLAETIEELVWQAVSELLRNPQILIEQYNQRQESGYGTPEQQEQQRLKRRLVGLERECQRLIDAYQSGVIELDDLKERRERIAEECRRLEVRLSSLEQQQQGQQRQAALATTVEEFCRNISTAIDNPSFETKQKILRLVVERVEFVEDQIMIKHVIPISDVRLQRDQLSDTTPKSAKPSDQTFLHLKFAEIPHNRYARHRPCWL